MTVKTSMCTSKVRYRDKKEAIRAMHRITSRSGFAVLPRRVYQCPFCLGWHLTSKEST